MLEDNIGASPVFMLQESEPPSFMFRAEMDPSSVLMSTYLPGRNNY